MPKKKKKKKTASPREAITEPLRRASAAQKKQWAKTEKETVRLRSGGAALFDELWETVHEVMSSDPPLYLGGEMRTAKLLHREDAASRRCCRARTSAPSRATRWSRSRSAPRTRPRRAWTSSKRS